jgi:DNA-binding transcriptional regulator YiaG
MTHQQFRNAIAKLGLSQVQAAHTLNVTPRTARRWALGEIGVPSPVEKLLRLMLAHKITPQEVRKTPPKFGA